MAGMSQISSEGPPDRTHFTVWFESGVRQTQWAMAALLTPDRTRADLREAGRCQIQLSPEELPHDRDRRVRAVRDHVDVVGFHDEPRVGIPFLLQHNLGEPGSSRAGLEPLVALCFRGIPAHIDECVFRTDAELCVALLRDPVADVRNSMSRINGSRAVGKPEPPARLAFPVARCRPAARRSQSRSSAARIPNPSRPVRTRSRRAQSISTSA